MKRRLYGFSFFFSLNLTLIPVVTVINSPPLAAQAGPVVPPGPVLPLVPAGERIFSETGDAAAARRYLEWARREYDQGRPASALEALERGAAYGSVLSDISWALALVRAEAGRSRYVVLEACRRALEADRWEGSVFAGLSAGPQEARFLEARTLVELRSFEAALGALEHCDPERYETQYLALRALAGLAESRPGGEEALIRAAARLLDRFPRETPPYRLLFEYAARREGGGDGALRPLIDLALRRLPVLVEADPDLAWMAVPFMYDKDEARRFVEAYRAGTYLPDPASLPAAVNLGVIGGGEAVDEFFGRFLVLDRERIAVLWDLLRDDAERDLMRRRLLGFTGWIAEDRDRDGIAEAETEYHEGMIREYRLDEDQDGKADLLIRFVRGVPESGRRATGGDYLAEDPVRPEEAPWARVRWERYPAVLDAELGDTRYIPRPLDFFYKPVDLVPLVLNGPLYPHREEPPPVLTGRSLLSFSGAVERPSGKFPGGLERVELDAGIPLRSTVYLEGRTVAETEFRAGTPLVERLDLDLDGRLETIRRYGPGGVLLLSESDWDGDGIYEYAETPVEGRGPRKSWDLDRDGIRETEEP